MPSRILWLPASGRAGSRPAAADGQQAALADGQRAGSLTAACRAGSRTRRSALIASRICWMTGRTVARRGGPATPGGYGFLNCRVTFPISEWNRSNPVRDPR